MDKLMFTREQAQQKKNDNIGTKASYLRIYNCQFCGAWHLTHKKN